MRKRRLLWQLLLSYLGIAVAVLAAAGLYHRQILRHPYLEVAAVVLAAGALAGISWYFSRRISRPLEELQTGARRFAGGDLSFRLTPVGFPEVDSVAEALNHMAEELDERFRTILRQQNEQEAVLTSMDEGVLAVDGGGAIINMNQTCARLLNIDPEGAQGRLVHEMIRKTDLLAFVEAALRGPEPIEGDLQLVGAEDRWLHARGSTLFDARRQKIGALVVLHDITRLRRLESIRRDFVANVSHELRTPVTSIKGFVETLLDGALDDPENARRFLNIVGRQANRLTAIIEDLLTLSRLEKGAESQTVALNREPLKAVLHAAVEMCSNKASEKEIRLELDCDEALVAAINAPLLEQAVVNLIDNAINYSERGSRVEIAAAAEENAVVIRVRDDGCGIEAGHLPRLFERFYRVDKARSRELGGTGLGLAIVKHIALAHQGLVHVESEVRRGSVFSLRLPQNSGFRQG